MSRFLAAYEDLFAKSTDAPVEFGHAGGLAVLSTIALGRRWIERGAGKIKPNVFMLLTADSSRDRKSTSVNIATDLVSAIEPKRLGPDDFTAEGLISFLSQKRPIFDDAGQPTGVVEPARNKIILPVEEFGTYLAASSSYAKTLAANMCRLYDGKRIEKARATGRTFIVVEDPVVSMLGGVAYGMLERYADEEDWITGFFARIVWITPINRRAPYITPPPTPKVEKIQVTGAIKSISLELQTAQDGAMQLTANAEQIHSAFAQSLMIDENNEDPAVVAQRERLLNVVWKLSMLYQIDIDSSLHISDVAVQRACALAQQAWLGFRIVYARCSGTRHGRLTRRVWEYITKHGERDHKARTGGVARRQIYHSLNTSVSDVIPILDMLYHGGIIGTYTAADNKTIEGYYIIQPYKKPGDK